LVSTEYTTSSRDAGSEFAAADPELRAQFDSIVKQALSTLGGTGAAFAIIEDDEIVFKARAGTVPEQVEFGGSFTASVIATRGALIVSDAATDDRFRSNPNVVGDIAIRHFAGFPVESASGERVGVICVFGPRPKPHDSELVEVVLRQLALHIQEVVRPN
jgi:GAF domain-containing protein